MSIKRIYVMKSDLGLTKIGIANDPLRRADAIRSASGSQVKLIHASIPTPDARLIESIAHRLLADKRRSGEWFDVSPSDAIEAIEKAVLALEREREELKRLSGPTTPTGRPRRGKEKNASDLIGVRVPPWIKIGLMQLAAKNGVSVSEVVVAAIGIHLAENGIQSKG